MSRLSVVEVMIGVGLTYPFNRSFAAWTCSNILSPFQAIESAVNGISDIYRLFEGKTHSGGQSADLTAYFSNQTGNKQAVTNQAIKVFGFGKSFVKMNRIVVAGDGGELHNVMFSEGTRYRNFVACN